MSNRRKSASGRAISERCTFCGRAAGGPRALRLRTGQVACPRCQEGGELQRLDCGHLALPGSFIVRNAGGTGDTRCPRCAPEDVVQGAGTMRLGLPQGGGSWLSR